MKKILAIALSAMMIFALIACGSKTGTKYVAKSAEMLGIEMSMDDLGMSGDTYIILNDDKTAEFAFSGEKETTNYTVVGTAITVDGVSVGEVHGEINDKTLSLIVEIEGMSFTINYEAQ